MNLFGMPLAPEPAIEVQITGVEYLVGRQHDYVRTFGYRVADIKQQTVEMHLTAKDAAAIIEHAGEHKVFPVIEVPHRRYTIVLNAGEVKIVHLEPA